MKKIIVGFLILCSLVSEGQIRISDMPIYTGASDSVYVPAVINGVNRRVFGVDLFRKRGDSLANAIGALQVPVIDTTSLSNRIAALASGDTASLSARINTKPTLTTIAGLRAFTTPSTSMLYQTMEVGYEGLWRWNASSTVGDNTGLVIKSSAFATGRFERLFTGAVWVTWFGAVGNNSRDNTTEFNNAIAAMGGKGTLYFPDGTFLGTISQSGVDGLTIIGNGVKNSIIKLPNGANRTLIKLLSSSNINILRIGTDGNKANNPTDETPDAGENNRNDNLYFSKGQNIYVDHCIINYARGNGYNFYRVLNPNVNYCEVGWDNASDNDQNGGTNQFAHTNETTAKDNGGTFTHNWYHDNPTGFGHSNFSAHGSYIAFNTTTNCKVGLGAEIGASYNEFVKNNFDSVDVAYVITGNVSDTSRHAFGNSIDGGTARHIRGGSTGLIQVGSAWGLKITGITLEGTGAVTGPGIGLIQSNDVTIDKVDISGATQSGILATIVSGMGCNRLTITDSKLHGNGEDGALLLAVPRLEFNNNRVYNNTRHGLQVQSSDKITYKNNFFYDDQAVATQQYGVVLTSCNGIVDQNNTFSFTKFTPDVNLIGSTNSNYITSGNRNIARANRSSAPSTGTYTKGDIVWDTAYTIGHPLYYIALATGVNPAFGAGPLMDSANASEPITAEDTVSLSDRINAISGGGASLSAANTFTNTNQFTRIGVGVAAGGTQPITLPGGNLGIDFGGGSTLFKTTGGLLTANISMSANNYYTGGAINNATSTNNLQLNIGTTGLLATRNVADANPVGIWNLINASSTAHITDFQWQSTLRFWIFKEGKLGFDATNTTTGTTGAQTINKPTGTVNIAAAGTSVVVTNSLVTTSSIVYAVVRTNDANATAIKSVVPASGSFTVTLTTAPAAEVSIGFIVFN